VILAVLHFGPLSVLRYWLRAQGLPAAGLVGRPSRRRSLYRQYLDRLTDAAGGVEGASHVFDLKQLRQAHQFLENRGLLIVAVEGIRTQRVLVRGDDFSFLMATGALRLAAQVSADVFPCLIRADYPWGFTAHFGEPVPPAWVTDKGRHAAACDHLLRQFLLVLHDQPEQCWSQLLICFQPAVPWPDTVLERERHEHCDGRCSQ
jgi:hypothetical protein